MLSFLLAVHFLLAILIIGLVLIQKHDSDGALGSVGGGGGRTGMVFSARGQANLLTRSTAVLMTLFFINCLVMAKIVKHAPHKSSIIEQVGNESVLSNGSPLKDNRIRKIDAAKTANVPESQKREASKTNTTPAPQKMKKTTPIEKKK